MIFVKRIQFMQYIVAENKNQNDECIHITAALILIYSFLWLHCTLTLDLLAVHGTTGLTNIINKVKVSKLVTT
jgi:hypothetical protein